MESFYTQNIDVCVCFPKERTKDDHCLLPKKGYEWCGTLENAKKR